MRIFSRVVLISLTFSCAIYLTLNLFRPGFPSERLIVNKEGKELSVVIVGKLRDTLIIERKSDSQRFQIPVHSLSLKDRFFVLRLPERAAPEIPKVQPIEVKEPEDQYVTNRLLAIEGLKKKAELYEKEIGSGTLNDLLQRSRIEELEGVNKEIRSLEVAIETYKFRNHTRF